MNKFHISDDGVVRPCDAKISCPIGGESIHFDSYDDAVKSSEDTNAEKYGNFSTVRRNKEEFAPRKVDNAVSKDDLKNVSRDSDNKAFKKFNETVELYKNLKIESEVDQEVSYMLQDVLGDNAEDMMSDEGIDDRLFEWGNSDSEIEREASKRVEKMLRK